MPQQYRVNWSGGRIGTGFSVLNFVSIGGGGAAQTIADAVRTWMFARQATFPNDVTFNFDSEVRELANDGTLLATYPVTVPAAFAGTDTGSWTNGAGSMARITTGVVTGGRRVQGRVFWVPRSGIYQNDGNVTSAAVTADQTAHNAFLAAVAAPGANLAVWSRTAALTAPAVALQTLSRPATLRTRNDR